jgi:undecaprenyl-diphosphatase
MAIKLLVRRRRPEGEWGAIYRRTDPHSFPSGHAARAGLLATLIAGWGPAWLAPILLVWAPLVILARVAMGLHYLSDVLAGAALGVLVGIGILQALG